MKRALLKAGYEVLDYREGIGSGVSSWWCKTATEKTPAREARSMMRGLSAQSTLWRNARFVRDADIVVAVQPSGVSTAAELALAVGIGKRTAVLLTDGKPELMLGLADYLAVDVPELLAFLGRDVPPCLWCWYVDHSDVPEDGGTYLDADEAERSEVAVTILNQREPTAPEEPRYNRATMVRTPYRAHDMNGDLPGYDD